MSRNKSWLAVLACVCFLCQPALSESPNLSSVESIRSDEVNYRTAEAEIGTYERFVTMQAAEYYPVVTALWYEGDGAKFVEYKAKRNDIVKAGDVLAVFSAETDEVALAAAKSELEQLRADSEAERARLTAQMDELTQMLKQENDPDARKVLMLRITRAEVSIERFDAQFSMDEEELIAKIAEMESASDDCVLRSPVDGMITSTHYLHVGDRVPDDEALITVQSMDKLLLRVNNVQGDFRYGMDVEITYGADKQKLRAAGRVVGSDTQLPPAQRSEYAYIEIDGWDGEEIVNPSVSAAACRLENIVLVPRRAIVQDDGKYMVQKLEDGTIHRRYVNFVMQNSSHAWIIQGVEPGETLVVE